MCDLPIQQPNEPASPCTACGNRFPIPKDHSPTASCPGCRAWDLLLGELSDDEPRLLADNAVLPNLIADTKRKAVYEIVDSLAKSGHLDETETTPLTAALLRREELASTGVGHGFAMPHTIHSSVSSPILALARSRSGIEFDSLDGKRVRVLALAVCPADQPGQQLQVLSTVARRFRDFDNRLREAGCLNL